LTHQELRIGRLQHCDIVIGQNTISREQCRIVFEPGSTHSEAQRKPHWAIMDGSQEKASANGTWVCLTDYRLRCFKQESAMIELEQGAEIKISETILKVEWTDEEGKNLGGACHC